MWLTNQLINSILIRDERFAVEELGEGLFGGAALEADQGAHEQA
jgi:hypothetical protein